MTFKVYAAVALLGLSLIAIAPNATAHSGRTASDGCHNDKKAGTRHCHGAKATTKKSVPKTSYQGTSSVYYPNCTAARKAGKSNIRRGQPGYARHLDRDNDGIACER